MDAVSNLLILILASSWCQDIEDKLSCRQNVVKCAQKYEKNIDKMQACFDGKE